jgi:Protein of unknown function (DUF3185)
MAWQKLRKSPMKKLFGLAALIVGIVLFCLAYNSSHSAAADVSRAVTGSSTNKTIRLVLGGIVATLLGFAGLLGGANKIPRQVDEF